MKNEQSCKIWTLSSDKAEYERFSYLLEKSDGQGIDIDHINALLRENTAHAIKGEPGVTLVHDPCDIRKPYSQKMESLDKVRSLEGKVVNGYRSFNSIALGADRIHLLGCYPFSSEEEDYAGEDPDRSFDKKDVAFWQIQACSQALKKQHPDQVITHLIDREADDQEFFAFISEELNDQFIIRLKINRNSDVYTWDEGKQKEVAVKLAQKPLGRSFEQSYEYFRYKGRTYLHAKAHVQYERMYLAKAWYWVVRIDLFNKKGKAIFSDPMLLVTNFEVNTHEMATHVYHQYLKRSKIEGVFKFLKTHLGWEEFQIRDLLAIKRIILLCYFVGAFFFEREPELTRNEYMIIICKIGGSKGKVTRHFFLKGLTVLAHYHIAEQFFKEHHLTKDDIKQLLRQLE